ncbi:ABC-type glycerol-3-phosphate transport system, substrate-binding protein [Cohnella sp. OV330]|uniref:extracellular solute-binding protein n=1 Tax=Cohnella sp. OV330 TaxID=1855288 RepID=UPI0008F1ED0E|nr:extracellular solute-binding protein [Cohnella sp. OV330]SFB35700.1 ABC-type glycerol-3-phosphate transport system, substrate-binding protein [Cohnella sp. OV330]
MTRRKYVVVLMLLMLAVLLTSPWASAPEPDLAPDAAPEGQEATLEEPVFAEQHADLTVKIMQDEDTFRLLEKQSEDFERSHPDIRVHLERVDPEGVTDLLDDWHEEADGADVALVPSLWVKRLAVSGVLMPADSAFEGDAMSEQFEAIAAPLKWNGYMWGVPHHMDPYVVVWNRARLAAASRPDGSALTLPLGTDDWASFGAEMASEGSRPWLAIDERDSAALLTWLGAATGLRPDLLLGDSHGQWGTGPAAAALDTLRGSVSLRAPDGGAAFWQAMATGQYAAAVTRLSVAEAGIASLGSEAAAGLSIDRSGWDKAYAFEGGASFVIGARTPGESAAKTWIAAMTETQLQLDNYDAAGYLPVYRTAYADRRTMPNLTGRGAQQFPNWAPEVGPDWPSLMNKIGLFWTDWRQERLSLADWPARWSGLLADLQLHD